MRTITDMLAQGPTRSFEFFPPKTEKGEAVLRATVEDLQGLDPSFVSVTYGAGGSTRENTQRIVGELAEAGQVLPMPHLTCIGHSREELAGILAGYRDQGLRNVLALHGDPPRDNPDLASGDLTRAAQLIDLAREVGDFCVGVAAHPEGHPKAPDRETDRRHQAAKLAVADFGITQFFFDVEDYLRLVDDLERLGVDTPIIAGVIPITDPGQVAKFAAMAGATVPDSVATRIEQAGDDAAEVRRIGVDIATEISQRLLDEGAPGLHIYTLNRPEASRAVYEKLGVTV